MILPCVCILVRWLEEADCDVQAFPGGAEFIEAIPKHDCDLLFLDLMMPAPNGVQTLESIRLLRPTLDVVIVTAYFDSRMMDDALEFGPLMILKKPVEKNALVQLVDNAVAKKA